MKDERTTIEKNGFNAAWDGLDSSSNPYELYCSKWSWWNDGWLDGKMGKCQSERGGMWQAFYNY